MNPTEEEWNEIVKKNFKSYHEEEENKKKMKLEKTKAIQAEQRRQAEEKRAIQKKQQEEDRQFYEQFGKKAFDKYYVSEDARKQNTDTLKGGANVQAKAIREKYNKSLKEKRDKMTQEAEERKKMIQILQNEENLTKQKTIEKKRQLKEIQEQDKMAKKETRLDLSKGPDFGSNNVLSWIYEKKPNKAEENMKRNEHLQKLIQNQFVAKD